MMKQRIIRKSENGRGDGSMMPHSDSESYRQSRETRGRSRDRMYEEYEFRLGRLVHIISLAVYFPIF